MRRKICGIYCISNDYFFYIGQSVDIYKRWTAHKSKLRKGNHENIIMQRVYNKYPKQFSYEVIIECSEEELTFMENKIREEFSLLYQDKQCMNIASCYQTWSEYSRKKASQSHSGKRYSEEHCKHISDGQRGNKRPAQRVKIVQLDLDGNLIKIWDSIKEASEVTGIRINLSRLSCGGFQWQRHSEWIENPKKKYVNPIMKRIVQKDMGGQVIKIWDSQSEASKVLGIRQGDIANILAGRQRSTRGFKFEYYNEK